MGEYRFKLPDIGEGVVEAEITAWHVALGDQVSEDDPIADAMTDKATIELTAPVDGVITTLACDEGDMLAVGADLVVFKTETEQASVTQNEPASKPSSQKSKTAKASPQKTAVKKPQKPTSDKALASPAVRKRAKEMGVMLSAVSATGKDGQVTQTDLDLLEKSFAPLEGETRTKVIGLRRVIAQRMQESKRHIPHFTYVEDASVPIIKNPRISLNSQFYPLLFAPWRSRFKTGRNLMPVLWMRVFKVKQAI